MTVMIAEMYDALIEAGATEEKARKAASVLADYDNQFADIKSDLRNAEMGAGGHVRHEPSYLHQAIYPLSERRLDLVDAKEYS